MEHITTFADERKVLNRAAVALVQIYMIGGNIINTINISMSTL